MRKIKRAIVSVYDKTGIIEFVKILIKEFKIEILSTGGTGALLEKNGLNYTKISDYTQSPEMFDGRVKSLHPKISGGILFRRTLQKDIEDAKYLYDLTKEHLDLELLNEFNTKLKTTKLFRKYLP